MESSVSENSRLNTNNQKHTIILKINDYNTHNHHLLKGDIAGDNYIDGNTNVFYPNSVNESFFISNTLQCIITTGESTVFKSRIWSFNENQTLIERYADYNDVNYNDAQHSYSKKLDTLNINFQTGNTQKFLINWILMNFKSHQFKMIQLGFLYLT